MPKKLTSNRHMKKTFLTEVREIIGLSYVKKTVQVGTELFSAVVPFLDNPGWWNASRSAFAVGKVLVDELEIWSDDYFSNEDWVDPYTRDFTSVITHAIKGYPYQELRTGDDANIIKIYNIEGIKLGYSINIRSNVINIIYVETAKLAQAKQIINNLLWEQLKDTNIVLRKNTVAPGMDENSKIILEPDDEFRPLTSERSTEYSTYLNRCITAGVSRSVMLYGPPGTGKSTMARTIVQTLNMKSFRIRVQDVTGIESSTLFEAISIFKPDAIILDDFDRAHSQIELLETLEYFQRHVKLVIATVNDRNSLDEALLRPGRFDELLLIDKMDADVVKHVLGDDLQDAFEVVKEWPIAFIQEYAKRRKFMTADEAAESTKELAARVERLAHYKEKQDVDVMLGLSNDQKKNKKLFKKLTKQLKYCYNTKIDYL